MIGVNMEARSSAPSDDLVQLGRVPLFKGLAADRLAEVRRQAHTKEAGEGELFFSEGDEADGFFVLAKGRVKLTQLTAEGHQVVLRMVGAGEAFGGAGAFGDETYPVGAEAVEPSVALVWTSDTIRQLMEREAVVALNALQFVARRLFDLQRRHRELMTERVERRVARALLRLVEEAGKPVGKGIEIDFSISRQDIAEMTGTTLYTVSRLLSAWEERGIVTSARQRITLTKPAALTALAEDLPGRGKA